MRQNSILRNVALIAGKGWRRHDTAANTQSQSAQNRTHCAWGRLETACTSANWSQCQDTIFSIKKLVKRDVKVFRCSRRRCRKKIRLNRFFCCGTINRNCVIMRVMQTTQTWITHSSKQRRLEFAIRNAQCDHGVDRRFRSRLAIRCCSNADHHRNSRLVLKEVGFSPYTVLLFAYNSNKRFFSKQHNMHNWEPKLIEWCCPSRPDGSFIPCNLLFWLQSNLGIPKIFLNLLVWTEKKTAASKWWVVQMPVATTYNR